MTQHNLKTWPEYFLPLWEGTKTFELRKNDRNYQPGDGLRLWEYNPQTKQYTGMSIAASVGYVLHGGVFGLPDDMCILSLIHTMRNPPRYLPDGQLPVPPDNLGAGSADGGGIVELEQIRKADV